MKEIVHWNNRYIGMSAAIAVPILVGVALIGIWIYLAWMAWKRKTKIFHDQLEPKLVEKRLRMLKLSLIVAAISFIGGIIGVIVHNVLYGINEVEEPVSFIIAILGLFVFLIATGYGFVIFLGGRQKPT